MILGELILGALIARVLWMASREAFGGYVFQRRNYRDHQLPTAVGALLPIVAAIVVAVASVVGLRRGNVLNWDTLSRLGPDLVGLCLGFALLGLLDDMGGAGQSGGFRGHVKSMFSGRLSTGALKLIGGPVIALAVLARYDLDPNRLELLRDAAIVCLAANLANLFDRAPGRTTKFGVIGFAAIWAAASSASFIAPSALVIGGAIGLLGPELDEEFMLGDAGSNVIGAALGYATVRGISDRWLWLILAVVALANVASELVSFSRVIDAVPPLRWFDRLGAPHRQA